MLDKAQRHYGREAGWGVDRKLDGVSEAMIDWDNTGVNRRQRTGEWGMDGGRRRRGEINMALIVSSAPLPSLDQPFITPPQSVQHRHFGKWGPALTPSAKTATATYVGVCVCVWSGEDRVYVRVCLCGVNVLLCDIHRDDSTVACGWVPPSHPNGWEGREKKNPNTFFIFFSFATNTINQPR